MTSRELLEEIGVDSSDATVVLQMCINCLEKTRNFKLRYVFALVALVLINSPLSAETPDCAALYEEHKSSDLTLSYKEFDQTMGSGFRVLAGAGCQEKAADLIELYIEANDAKQSSLRWHIAQLRAGHGDYAEAIEYANTVLLEEEDQSGQPLRWNDYVLASIAFWERDKEALVHHRDQVAKGVEDHPGNELNLRLLDALIEHFDESYEFATSNIN